MSVDQGIPSVDFSSEVVTLLPVGPGDDQPVPGHGVVRRVVTAVAGDKGGGRRPFSVGVSRVARSLEELPDAYAQARRAVEVGRRVHGGGSTTFFDQLGVHRLIALIPDPAELQAFTRDVLGPLAEPTPEAADLRETLQVLLDTNFNVAEAARIQFFHYNTMRYRVSKLERLLGPAVVATPTCGSTSPWRCGSWRSAAAERSRHPAIVAMPTAFLRHLCRRGCVMEPTTLWSLGITRVQGGPSCRCSSGT